MVHVFFPSLLYFLLFACLTAALALARSRQSPSGEKQEARTSLSVQGLHSLSGVGVQQVGFGFVFLKLHKSQQEASTEASGRLL